MRVQKIVCSACGCESGISIPIMKDANFVRTCMELEGWQVCSEDIHICPRCVSAKYKVVLRDKEGTEHKYPLVLSSPVGAESAIEEIKEALRAWLPETFVEELEFDWIPWTE